MLLGSSPTNNCPHADVVVDYDHPFGRLPGVRVADLKAVDPARTRPVMTLLNARCGTCGAKLPRRLLRTRTCGGGDLFDPRFAWS